MSSAVPPGATAMTVQVRLFASLREQAGWSERRIPLEAATATPLALWRQLQLPAGGASGGDPAANAATPSLGPASECGADQALPEGIRVAINRAFAAADTPLADGDELAFLPPISGG